MKKKVKGIVIKITIVLFLIAILFLMLFLLPRMKEQETVRKMPINEINLSAINDGVYKGDFTYSGFTYVVEVTIQDKKIDRIKILKNRDDDYAKKAEEVVDRVLLNQTLKVDTVTGATTTSKALLKAIENALSGK